MFRIDPVIASRIKCEGTRNLDFEKDIFKELGIENKDIVKFNAVIRDLARDKELTDKFKLVSPVLKELQALSEALEYELAFEYTETAAVITIKIDDAGVFIHGSMQIFRDVISKVDALTIENDEEKDHVIMMRFIINDIFKLW